MTLKQLISFKFIIYVAATAGLLYLSFTTFDYYSNLRQDNNILHNQNRLYKQILAIDPSDVKGREKIDLELKLYSRPLNYAEPADSDEDRMFWLLGYVIVIMYALRFFDEKIEKKKDQINDRGEML